MHHCTMYNQDRGKHPANGETIIMHIYEEITNRIIAQLEQGIIPWRKEWTVTGESGLPANFQTKKPYRGINILTLMATPYASRWWMTYKQAQELGGQVRKGERGQHIVFWKFDKKVDAATGDEEKIAFARMYTVFNLEQVDGITAALPLDDGRTFDPIAEADAVVTAYMSSGNHPTLAHGGDRAFYRPSTDHVQMPPQTAFSHPRAYYSTAFHELTHSTAAPSRLDRKLGHTFGDCDYSKEELIAELGASFLCADAGIACCELLTNSAAYIQAWLHKLRNDKTLVVSAAQHAQKACDFILGRKWDSEG